MARRIDRVNELLRTEISHLLARQIKDPRLSGVISITRVSASRFAHRTGLRECHGRRRDEAVGLGRLPIGSRLPPAGTP